MKAVVTGAAGFIGSHLTEHLIEMGYDVLGIDCFTDFYPRYYKDKNLQNALQSPRFEFLESDLLQTDLSACFSDCDVVFHLAAQAGVRSSWGANFKVYTDFNVLGTQRVLESAKEAKLKRIVYASSSSVYGEVTEFPMRESSILRPFSPYGVTKLAGENLCLLYANNFKLHTVSLRYFTVFGPRQRPDMAFHIFGRQLLGGDQPVVFGNGRQSRDFTYVSDIVQATFSAAGADVPKGSVFNIGGGSRISLNSALQTLVEISGRNIPPRNDAAQKGDVSHTAADISLAQKYLNYEPKIRLTEGLEREWQWLNEFYSIYPSHKEVHYGG
jgi:nucleoside-diphosphate-sugar epimerase